MKHSKNFIIRLLYFIGLFIIYRALFSYFNININIQIYGMYISIMFFSYIVNILNFYNQCFGIRDMIYIISINFFVFCIFILYYKKEEIIIIYIFAIFSITQILAKFLFVSLNRKVENLIIIDSGEYTEKLIGILEKKKEYFYMGYVGDYHRISENYLGKIENLEHIIKEKSVDIIVFTSREQAKKYADLLLKLKLTGIKVIDYINILEYSIGRIDVDKIDDLWILMTNGFDILSNRIQKKIKRIFDLVFALFIFILFSPFMLCTYVIVKLDVGLINIFVNPLKIINNPVFFKQKRIGKGGKEFEIVKFRSMQVHDPSKFSKYASENDSRITAVGKFIRKTRLDEFPQLINILKGDMSFVGPRPEWNELGKEYEKKINNYKLRYAVQAGLTGWAQVMYGYSNSIDEAKIKLEYDLYYIKHQNLILDIIILFKTCKIILFRKGK